MQKYLMALFIMLSTFLLQGQNITEGQELKVGLVLSGGGAKGLAHIGVLKTLEEAGVKIDYIGGTSMGAIVGALYASGYSADELEALFSSINFNELIKDELPRRAKTFYEKDDTERYALTLPFDNMKISFPEAISGGQHLYNLLVKELYHVRDIRNFNELPIPFFCIATDVETGKEIVLNKGYLPEAIMASGTFPSLFEPAEIDGKILIDGGIVNNYPVEGVLAMGANFIIGVDVQDGLANRESLKSAAEVLLQISNYAMVEDMKEKERKTNIYIKPDVENYSVIDFEFGKQILENGKIAAMGKIDEINALAARQAGKIKKEYSVIKADSINVNRLLLTGNENYSRGYIKGKLRFDLAEKITFNKLQEGISNLASTSNFKTIRYDLESNGVGVDLNLRIKENPIKSYIRMGVHYDDLFKSAALINLTKKHLFMGDDVASFDFILGDKLRYKAKYYVDKGSYWSFGLNSRYISFDQEVGYDLVRSNFNAPIDGSINVVNLDVTDLTNQFYVQTVWGDEFVLSLGAEHKFLKYSTHTLNLEIESDVSFETMSQNNRTIFEKNNIYSTYGKMKMDTYNNKYFPTKGLYFDGDFHFYMFSSDFNNDFKEYSIAKAKIGAAFILGRNFSLNLETSGGLKFGISPVKSLDFVLGGYGNNEFNNVIPFLGYDFLSLHGNSYVKALGRLDFEFLPRNHFVFSANYANVADDLFRTGDWFTEPSYSGYGMGYGWESFFGPVQLIYSWSPQIKESNVFISLGYWF